MNLERELQMSLAEPGSIQFKIKCFRLAARALHWNDEQIKETVLRYTVPGRRKWKLRPVETAGGNVVAFRRSA